MCLVLLTGCMPREITSTNELAQTLYDEGQLVSDHKLVDDVRLHYVVRQQLADSVVEGPADAPVKTFFVFIHGTPGDWRSFGKQLADNDLASGATLIALDRPSWGGSFFEEERVEPSLGKQAALIAPLLFELKESNPTARVVLVGHSLGATLAPLIAMVYPKALDAVVVIAGDLNARLVEKKWYNTMLAWPWVRPLLPREICYANDEVVALRKNIEAMEGYWEKLKKPMMVIQGDKDSLVNPLNADYAEHLSTPGGVRVERVVGAGHILHITHAALVNKLLLDWLQQGFATDSTVN